MPVSNMARGAGGNLAKSELDSYTPAMNDGSDRRLQETVSRPDLDPMSPGPTRDMARWIAIAIGVLLGLLFLGRDHARAAWQELAQLLSLEGKPEPASANVLSEHEIEALDKMPAQSQAELLLERSINHYRAPMMRSPGA